MICPPGSEVLLLRHGESTWNLVGRWQGQADPHLTAGGVCSATALAPQLARFDFHAVYCSDLNRARQTAEILATALSLSAPVADTRLRERDIGGWTGLTDSEIASRWPGQPESWRADDAPPTPAGGERLSAVILRTRECLEELNDEHSGSRLLVVTHSGVIGALDRAAGAKPTAIPNLSGRWWRRDCTGAVLANGVTDVG